MRPQRLPHLGPRIKMISRCNRPANPLTLPHAPKLLKRRRPIDTRLVRAGRLIDIVRPAVRRHGALFRGPAAGVVGPVGLDNVVLDQRVARPAVQRDVGVYVGRVPGARVGYRAARAGVPAFACDEVAHVGPGYVVFAGCLGMLLVLGSWLE